MCVVITIILDVFCRALVFMRCFCFKVQYSTVRLVVLRITLSIGVICVFIASLFDVSSLQGDSFRTGIISLSALPFTLSAFHLTYRLRGKLGLALALPFSFSLLTIPIWNGFLLAVFFLRILLSPILPPDARLLTLNKYCSVSSDHKQLLVEAELLLKSDGYDAVAVGDNDIKADLKDQIVNLMIKPPGTKMIVTKDRPVHGIMTGQLSKEPRTTVIKCDLSADGNRYFTAPEPIARMSLAPRP
jgi:hypothetical protein